MEISQIRSTKDRHFIHSKATGYEFNPSVIEISVLDGRGLSIWKQSSRGEQIRWNGIGTDGQVVRNGSYILKITYDPKNIVYVPFVVM